jgi:hypothetical protein
MERIMFLITKYHHFGSNILGLTLLLAWTGITIGAVQAFDPNHRALGAVLFFLGVAVIAGVDLFWRCNSEPRESLWRFVLPGSGGSLGFHPIWLFLTAPIVAVMIWAIYNQLVPAKAG